MAGETAIHLPGKMDREGAAGSGTAAGDGARAAELITAAGSHLEADQVQDLPHRDLPPKLLIFRRMAPSTMRSRKAIARGGSPRYSLHASKSIFVARAV